MNAKNDTPDETAPETPAAPETPKAAEETNADASGKAPATGGSAKPADKPAAKKPAAKKTPAKQAEKTAAPDATPAPAAPVEPVAAASTPAVDATTPVAEAPATATDPAAPAADPAATGEVAPAAPVQTVYVTAPNPPKPKGNRIIGSLLAVVATIVFAVVFAGVVAILIQFNNPMILVDGVVAFLGSAGFLIPVLVFLVLMILWALMANRAGWWSWVIGSFVIGALTYFASIGILILLGGGFALTASETSAYFVSYALNPALIAAGLIARESAIWFGAAIAKRGRKVRERNYAAWQAFENEEALKRAEFAGTAAA